MPPDDAALWTFLPFGYLVTVAIELPVLLVGLSPMRSTKDHLVAGCALTAFAYPIVICVLPSLLWAPSGSGWYLAVAETFAPLAGCLLFRIAFGAARRPPAGGRAPPAQRLDSGNRGTPATPRQPAAHPARKP